MVAVVAVAVMAVVTVASEQWWQPPAPRGGHGQEASNDRFGEREAWENKIGGPWFWIIFYQIL